MKLSREISIALSREISIDVSKEIGIDFTIAISIEVSIREMGLSFDLICHLFIKPVMFVKKVFREVTMDIGWLRNVSMEQS